MHKLPNHVAIIMDGNGRWAKQQNLPRFEGHRQGVETVKNIINFTVELKLPVLTLFALSLDNLARPQTEIEYLLLLLAEALDAQTELIHQQQIKFKAIGDLTSLPRNLTTALQNLENLTQKNSGLQLNLALNYSGRWDIIRACRQISNCVKNDDLKAQDINEKVLSNFLSLNELPDPDLLIRTGGEQRLSNFMLWQLSYTELYFSKLHWPEFSVAEFKQALNFYQARERRFGKIFDAELDAETVC